MDARVKPAHDAVVLSSPSAKHLWRPRAHRAVGRWPPASRTGRRIGIPALGESARNLWMGLGEVKDGSSRRNRWPFHTGASHFAARSVCSLAPRSAAERGEGWGEGRLSARPPHPIPDVATTEPPSPRKRGEGAITTTARVVTSHHFSHSLSRSRGAVLRPGFAFGFAHPNFGVAERRETYRCLRGTGWACTIGAGQAPSEAPRVPIRGTPASRRSHRGDFWLRCRASPHRHYGRIGHSELLASGS
jgi:hypothetical protein